MIYDLNFLNLILLIKSHSLNLQNSNQILIIRLPYLFLFLRYYPDLLIYLLLLLKQVNHLIQNYREFL